MAWGSDAPIPDPRTSPGDPGTPGPTAPSVTGAKPPECPTRTRAWRAGRLVAEGFPASEIAERLEAHAEEVVWLDLFDPEEGDLQVVVDEFGPHPLAVEDAVADRQRPKLDRYRTHRFLNVYAVEFDPSTCRLASSEISAFITPRGIVTVRKAPFDVDALVARWDAAAVLAGHGVGWLLHGLLDAVVDGHQAAIDLVDEGVEQLEEHLLGDRGETDLRRQAYELRKALIGLRRVVLPMRELVRQLLRVEPDRASLRTTSPRSWRRGPPSSLCRPR